MEKRRLAWGLLTAAVVMLWLVVTYLFAFLSCLKVYRFLYLKPGPPGGIPTYVVFSRNEVVGESLHAFFRPCVRFGESRGWFIYMLAVLPDYYQDDWLPGRFGWRYFLAGGYPLYWPARGVAIGEVLATALLAAVLVGHRLRWRRLAESRPGRQAW